MAIRGDVVPRTVADCLAWLEQSPIWDCPWCGFDPYGSGDDHQDAVLDHVELEHGEAAFLIYRQAKNEYARDRVGGWAEEPN
jgi:hypothetical protein